MLNSTEDLSLVKLGPAAASLLDPAVLSEVSARAVQQLLREGESKNTAASYRAALRYWSAWFALRYGRPIQLPVPEAVVLQFVVDHAQRSEGEALRHDLPEAIDRALVASGFKGRAGPLALNTLTHRIYVLSKAHQLRSLPNPCQQPAVRELLARTRRAYAKRGPIVRKKDALTRVPLEALLATCDDSLQGLRDRALLLFAWGTGGRRRSEVTGADMRFLKTHEAGEFSYELAQSKANQAGADRAENHKPVLGAAADALRRWLDASDIRAGPIFRQVRRGGHLGGPLSPAAVRTIVRRRCAQAGLQGDFSAHSLRSGFVTEACRMDVALAETMTLTGHRSVQTLVGYTRTEGARRAASRVLGDAPQPAGPAP